MYKSWENDERVKEKTDNPQHIHNTFVGARGDAAGGCNALQTEWLLLRLSIMSLELFIDIILAAALLPCGLLSL